MELFSRLAVQGNPRQIKFILLAEGLEFFPQILVYLYVDVHPDMESRPKQIRTQTGRFVLPNPRRGKNLNASRPAAFGLRNLKSEKGLSRVNGIKRWILDASAAAGIETIRAESDRP